MSDHVVTLDSRRDNGRDHRAGTIDSQAEKSTRKSGFACIALLCGAIYVLSRRNPLRIEVDLILSAK